MKKAAKTWGDVYQQHLHRGEDHGFAAHAADIWQKKHQPELYAKMHEKKEPMIKTETTVFCDWCHEKIEGTEQSNKAIHLEKDPGCGPYVGIWFGDIEQPMKFNGEDFCSLGCLMEFIKKWHTEKKSSKNKTNA